MSLFGDLKKVFFGAKSVAKHQAQKAAEAAKEIGEDLKEQAEDLAEAAKHKFDEVSHDLTEKGSELVDKAKHKAEELSEIGSEYADKAKHKAEELTSQGKEVLGTLGDKVYEETESITDKGKELRDRSSDWINERLGSLNTSGDNSAADLAADAMDDELQLDPIEPSPKAGAIDFESDLNPDPGMSQMPKQPSAGREATDQVLDKAAQAGLDAKAAAERLGGKLMDVSEKVGEKVLDKGSDLLDKAAGLGADLKGKADDLVAKATAAAEKESMEEAIQKAKDAAEQAAARARAFGGKETTRDASASTLDGTDSFFDRAAKFADGDYHHEGKVRVVETDKTIETTDITLKKKGNLDITGFEDKDGDGDALIDDAEIDA